MGGREKRNNQKAFLQTATICKVTFRAFLLEIDSTHPNFILRLFAFIFFLLRCLQHAVSKTVGAVFTLPIN
jgi:hypothetical protein